MSSLVTGQFQEDYPESYLRDGVALEAAVVSSQSSALARRMGKEALSLRERQRQPDVSLTVEQLRREYAWIEARLFGPAVGLELYEEKSDRYDVVYRDSVDEVCEQWRERFEERFGRDPPLDLVDYIYPRRDLDDNDRKRIRLALQKEFDRLSAIADEKQKQEEAKKNQWRAEEADQWLAVPKGLYRCKNK